jgi:hypothetical protein
MRNKDFAAIGRQLCKFLPDFRVRSYLMFLPPVRVALKALCFESSSHEKADFYVWHFILPLFVPTDHVYFNFGSRLRVAEGGDRWSSEAVDLVADLELAVRTQALPIFNEVQSPERLAYYLTKRAGGSPIGLEAAAYAYLYAGSVAGWSSALAKLRAASQSKRPSDRQILQRTEIVENAAERGLGYAQLLLTEWEQETLNKLGLQGHQAI